MGKLLVDFIYVVMILISLGDGNSNIPGGTRSMSKTINRCSSLQGICGLVGVSKTCSTLHQQGCSLTMSRGHCPVVPTSFVDFATAMDQIEALDFRLKRLIGV